MTSPVAVAGKGWIGNAFSKDKIERDFISSVQSDAKKRGSAYPGTYTPNDGGGIKSDTKNIRFFYGKDKKKSLFTQAAERSKFVPGVGTYVSQDIYREKPKLTLLSK